MDVQAAAGDDAFIVVGRRSRVGRRAQHVPLPPHGLPSAQGRCGQRCVCICQDGKALMNWTVMMISSPSDRDGRGGSHTTLLHLSGQK